MSAAERLEPCLRCDGGWRGGEDCRLCRGSGLRVAAPAERARPLHPGALDRVTQRLTGELARRRRIDAEHEAGAVARGLRLEAPGDVLPLLRRRGHERWTARELAEAAVLAVEQRTHELALWVQTREGRERRELVVWAYQAREALRRAE